MDRRNIHRHGASLLAAPVSVPAQGRVDRIPRSCWSWLERRPEGRLGVAVIDTGKGTLVRGRLDEPFPLCSMFKWLATAVVLHRVDTHREPRERPIVFGLWKALAGRRRRPPARVPSVIR